MAPLLTWTRRVAVLSVLERLARELLLEWLGFLQPRNPREQLVRLSTSRAALAHNQDLPTVRRYSLGECTRLAWELAHFIDIPDFRVCTLTPDS
jgi:hypothetical protein